MIQQKYKRTICSFIPVLQVTLFLLLIMLSGCGNRGDLYLPEKPQEQKQDD